MTRAYFRATRPDMTLTPADLCAPFDPAKALRPSGYAACPECGKQTASVLCGARACAVAWQAHAREAERLAAALERAALEDAEVLS